MADVTICVSEKSLKIATIGIAATIVVSLFSYLWSSGLFIPKYHLSVFAPDIEGLVVESPVMLDGVPVGTLKALKVAQRSANPQRRIELVLSIENRYQNDIRSDSTATVQIQGFLGNALLNIRRGFGDRPIEAGKEIPFVQTPVLKAEDFATLLARLEDCQRQTKQKTEGAAR